MEKPWTSRNSFNLYTDARSFSSQARNSVRICPHIYNFEPRTVLPLHATRGFEQFGKQAGNRGDVARSICVVARLAVLVCCMTDDYVCAVASDQVIKRCEYLTITSWKFNVVHVVAWSLRIRCIRCTFIPWKTVERLELRPDILFFFFFFFHSFEATPLDTSNERVCFFFPRFRLSG